MATSKRREPGEPGPPAPAVLHPGLGAEPADLVMPRLHGLSPLYDSGVDIALRHMGVTTIVVTGVSVNVALTATVIDAVNRDYQVVVPRDAVAGVGAEYVKAVLDNTLALLATLTTTTDLVDVLVVPADDLWDAPRYSTVPDSRSWAMRAAS